MSKDIIARYNYDEFTKVKVLPWLNFKNSPPIGETAPSFPLWGLDGEETSLEQIWSANLFTIVEFGSFT